MIENAISSSVCNNSTNVEYMKKAHKIFCFYQKGELGYEKNQYFPNNIFYHLHSLGDDPGVLRRKLEGKKHSEKSERLTINMKKILFYGLICICCVVFAIVGRKCELYMEDRISYGINDYEKTIWKSQNPPITVKVMRDYDVQVELPIGEKLYHCRLGTIGNGIFNLFRKDAVINYHKEDEWGGLDICIIRFSYKISDEEMIWYNIDDSPDAEGTEVQGDFSKYKKITFFRQSTESE